MDRDQLAATLAAALPGIKLANLGDQTPGWRPEPGRCHENARRWVEANPGFTVVHGWLNARGETFENRLRFHSHSVVRGPNGDHLDVTLRQCDPTYAFISHPLGDDHFRQQVIEKLPTIDHLTGPDPVILMEWRGEDPRLDNRLF